MKKILKLYEEETYKISESNDEVLQFQSDCENYKLVNKYYRGEITLRELCDKVDGCPPNSCYWCEAYCHLCTLKRDEDGCMECWRLCLEQEI